MKDKKLEEAIDYVCSCCPYIFSGSAEWNKSNPAFAGWRDSATKYCDRCMVRKMTDFYNALDDRQLVEYLEGEEVPIIAKIPRAVALSRAAAAGVSVAEYDPKSHVVAPIELLADSVLNEEEKNNG